MYQRVLLKLSGEVFGGGQAGLDYSAVEQVARQVASAHELGTEIGIVIGGGNIIRGRDALGVGVQRTTADYMGMLATVINSLALQSVLEEKLGIQTRVQTAISVQRVAEDYIRRRAMRHFEKGRIVIFGGGTGNPFFSTDTAAAMRAMEIEADLMIKATKVDGVYDKDPKVHSNAKLFERLSYMDVLNGDLKIIDSTAISLCMENKLPIRVMDIFGDQNIKRAIEGEKIGTLISE